MSLQMRSKIASIHNPYLHKHMQDVLKSIWKKIEWRGLTSKLFAVKYMLVLILTAIDKWKIFQALLEALNIVPSFEIVNVQQL